MAAGERSDERTCTEADGAPRRPALLAVAALSAPLALPAHASTFTGNEFVTWSQSPEETTFAESGNPAECTISGLLENNFDTLFAPFDLLEVGIPGAGGFSMIFDSADAMIAYLPASGDPGPLTADLLDPVHTASGAFRRRSGQLRRSTSLLR